MDLEAPNPVFSHRIDQKEGSNTSIPIFLVLRRKMINGDLFFPIWS
jgi:hypothetical protein